MKRCAIAVGVGALLAATAARVRAEAPTTQPAGQAAAAVFVVEPAKPNVVTFAPVKARFVRFVIHASVTEPCIDELEVYTRDGGDNLALASGGTKATASSCLSGYPIHQVPHLNDGLYGNSHSWIAAGSTGEWAQIELPQPAEVAKVVFSRDRDGRYRDRLPGHFEVRVSPDGQQWAKVFEANVRAGRAPAAGSRRRPAPANVPQLPSPPAWEDLLRYAFLNERRSWRGISAGDPLSALKADRPALPGGPPYWAEIIRMDALSRALRQMDDLAGRLEGVGLDVSAEREQLAELRRRQASLGGADVPDPKAADQLYLDARLAKRRLFFRDPALADLGRILFVKRHPYEPSHNYSDYLDSRFRGGGGICVLSIPSRDGRLEPAEAELATLYDAGDGIARDPVADFDARRVCFAHRPAGVRGQAYWSLYAMDADGGNVRRLTEGPHHDYYPCWLPDGGIAFVSTRCKSRYLCWVPMACVLFRMDADGGRLRPLSYANVSEWAPSMLADGRIIWTRSEYIDKGANFGHTLWAIRPDGTHPELVYGNNTKNCCMNGREVPGTREICCTLISHFGDFNGPIALVDVTKGRFNPDAPTIITPDRRFGYDRGWPRTDCFRDPVPISRDHVLLSHAPYDRFGLYVIDRYGNRELLYLDPDMGAMSPTPLRRRARPPVLCSIAPGGAAQGLGQFVVADVYEGLGAGVKRGSARYIRVCQEIRSDLEAAADGGLKQEYRDFGNYYATPVNVRGGVRGPSGWPSYVAKGTFGVAPVEADGSANFLAPAGKVLYFELLDGDFNEIQRMRSVVQLQPGEKRSCVGCHEERSATPPTGRIPEALGREPSRLEEPPWGAGPFAYEKVVQVVWDAKCIRCHDAKHKKGLNLTGALDAEKVPVSYRTVISRGLIHYFDWGWGRAHAKAEPLTFGTVRSKLFQVLDAGHHDVKLTPDEARRIKCWIDLNCPLWADYRHRSTRPGATAATPPPPRPAPQRPAPQRPTSGDLTLEELGLEG